MIAYLSGRFCPLAEASIPLGDRGLLFGDGVYEVYRLYGGRPFRLKEHLERLYRSAQAIRLELPPLDYPSSCRNRLSNLVRERADDHHAVAGPAEEAGLMTRLIRRAVGAAGVLAVLSAGVPSGWAETTLEKVARSGTLVVGTRTGSPPFGFRDKDNQWVGFSIDLARLVHGHVEKKVGKPVKLALKESTPATRIQLLTSGGVDLIAGTMTITRARRESVDFSAVFFVTGAQFLVKKGSSIRGIRDVAGKRIGALKGSTNEKAIREKHPQAQLVVFLDQPAAFTALAQGKIDAYTNDGVQLAGLKAKAPNPGDWEVVGEFYTYEPYGMAMRKNDTDFRNVVDFTLMEAIESGTYEKLYDKWFGPRGEVPYPLSETARVFLQLQVMPK